MEYDTEKSVPMQRLPKLQKNGNDGNQIELNRKAKLPIINRLSLNHFPNDPTKHIDYVIFYKDTPQTQKNFEMKRMRNKFIMQLKREGFETYLIQRKREKPENSKSNYLLLNCSIERLMEEAERMYLEVPLKEVRV